MQKVAARKNFTLRIALQAYLPSRQPKRLPPLLVKEGSQELKREAEIDETGGFDGLAIADKGLEAPFPYRVLCR